MRSIKQLIPGILVMKSKRKKENRRAKKFEARREKYESNSWDRSDDVSRLKYADYDAYLSHQASKLDGILDRLQERGSRDRAHFVERFRSCSALGEARVVLCVGARIGSEVAAFLSLGYFAVGIDLNPGPDNPYVLHGDFHQVVFPDNSVDLIYSNALDHTFDLDKLVSEVRRLLRPGGIFLVDLVNGTEEGFYPGGYESMIWANAEDFAKKIADIAGFTIESSRDDLPEMGGNQFVQAVLRKPVTHNSNSTPGGMTSGVGT